MCLPSEAAIRASLSKPSGRRSLVSTPSSAVNRHDHGELIRHLQRLESWLVIENVAPRLIGALPCITLHNAIYSTMQSLPAVEEAFAETFDELGIRLRVKTEAAGKTAAREAG